MGKSVIREKLINPGLNKTDILINSVSIFLFTSLSLYMTAIHNELYLFKLQDLSLFLPTNMFFINTISTPGGFLAYLGLFLTQFFYYPWLGSLILIFLLFVVHYLTMKAFDLRKNLYPLSFIPSLLLLLTILQLGYYIFILYSNGYVYSTICGIIVVLGTFRIYRSIKNFNIKLLFSVLYITVFFPLTGFYSLLSVLLFVVDEIVTLNTDRWKDHLGISILSLVFMIVIPLLFYRYFYISTSYPDLYFAGLPKLGFTGDIILWLPYYALFAFLIVSVFNFQERIKQKTPNRLSFTIPAIVFLLVMSGVYYFSYDDENFRTELAMERAVEENDWNVLLSLSKRLEGEPTRLIVMDTYLALRKLHIAGDNMFTYKNGYEPFNTRKSVLEMEVAGKMFYLQYGMVNYCYRWCMEDMITNGMKIENLKYFVKSCLLNNEIPLAQKYNDVLKKTLFHRSWAAKYEEYIKNPGGISSDPEFKAILPLIDPINKLQTEKKEMLEDFLIYSFATIHAGSPELIELALQCNLEMKNSNRFWPFFNYYIQTHSRIPVHYQEAALLFSYLEKNVDISKINFDAAVLNNFREFINRMKQYAKRTRKELEPIFMKYFGNTYWYYYFFSKSIGK